MELNNKDINKENLTKGKDININYSDNIDKNNIPFINDLKIIPNNYIEKINEKIIRCNNIKYKKNRNNKYKKIKNKNNNDRNNL